MLTCLFRRIFCFSFRNPRSAFSAAKPLRNIRFLRLFSRNIAPPHRYSRRDVEEIFRDGFNLTRRIFHGEKFTTSATIFSSYEVVLVLPVLFALVPCDGCNGCNLLSTLTTYNMADSDVRWFARRGC